MRQQNRNAFYGGGWGGWGGGPGRGWGGGWGGRPRRGWGGGWGGWGGWGGPWGWGGGYRYGRPFGCPLMLLTMLTVLASMLLGTFSLARLFRRRAR